MLPHSRLLCKFWLSYQPRRSTNDCRSGQMSWQKLPFPNRSSQAARPTGSVENYIQSTNPNNKSNHCRLSKIKINNKLKRFIKFMSHLPAETKTLSELQARAFKIESWPLRFWINSAFGNFHCFMLSGEADAIEYHFGCSVRARTLFLWFVKVHIVFPATMSQHLIVESWLDVII